MNRNVFGTNYYLRGGFIAMLIVWLIAACNSETTKLEEAPLSESGTSQIPDDVSSPIISPQSKYDMVLVKAGEFIRGSNKSDDSGMQTRYGFPYPLYQDERPEKKVYLDAFWIDRYEVTQAMYKDYILSTKSMMPFDWVQNGYALSQQKLNTMNTEQLRKIAQEYIRLDEDTRQMDKAALLDSISKYQGGLDNFPASGISWFNAKAYCEWRNARLPSEAEWEKAARGPNGLEYPWGNDWDPDIANTGDNGEWEQGIAPVGAFTKNVSPYGVYDMAGNVWEWVADWYQAYDGSEYQNELFGKKLRVIRGGGGGVGHYALSIFFRGASRQYSEPELETDDVGFRCAQDA